jgi:hypothetical protein
MELESQATNVFSRQQFPMECPDWVENSAEFTKKLHQVNASIWWHSALCFWLFWFVMGVISGVLTIVWSAHSVFIWMTFCLIYTLEVLYLHFVGFAPVHLVEENPTVSNTNWEMECKGLLILHRRYTLKVKKIQ